MKTGSACGQMVFDKGSLALVGLALAACMTVLPASAWAGEAAALKAVPDAQPALGVQASVDEIWGLESIYAAQAWEKAKASAPADGGQPVGIAVIDKGFNADHEDLKANVAASWNAADYNPARPNIVPTDVAPPATMSDEDRDHGTHVAGVLGAVAGNGVGIDGVSYNAQLVLVRVSDAAGDVSVESIIKAYDLILAHAQEYNIRVINASVGSPVDAMPEKGDVTNGDALLYDRIDSAFAQGIVTVCSAGNEGGSGYNFPSDYDPVVSVMGLKRQAGGLLDSHKVKRDDSYSNYNAPGQKTKDICAPGTEIYSTTSDGSYGKMRGTSQAAAFVSGTLALVFAANPSFTAEQAVERIYATATDLGAEGWDEDTGYGEVNALRAVDPDAALPGEAAEGSSAGEGGAASGDAEKGAAESAGATGEAGSAGTTGAAGAAGAAGGAAGTAGGAASDAASAPASDAQSATAPSQLKVQKPKITLTKRTAKASQLKKKAKKLASPVKVKNAKGKVSYKLLSVGKKAAKSKISLNAKTGKLTLKRGLKKASYKLKIQVKIAGTKTYAPFTKTVTATLKVG